MSISKKEIVHALFFQFTEGCNSVLCDNDNCKSCSQFKHKFTQENMINQAAKLAFDLSGTFKSIYCKGMLPHLLNPKIMESARDFDLEIKKLSTSGDISDMTKLENCIKSLVDTPESIMYLFSIENDLKLWRNPFDEGLIITIMEYMQKNRPVFQKFKGSFELLIKHHLSSEITKTYHHIRGLLVCTVLCFYFQELKCDPSEMMLMYINHVLTLDPIVSNELFLIFSKYPNLICRFNMIIQYNFTLSLLNNMQGSFVSSPFPEYNQFIGLLSQSASNADRPVLTKTFYNDLFTDRVFLSFKQSEDVRDLFQFKHFSTINLSVKYILLKVFFEKIQAQVTRELLFSQILNTNRVSQRDISFVLEVNRNNLVDDTVRIISKTSAAELGKRLLVVFKGEQGVDAGGISREFFFLLIGNSCRNFRELLGCRTIL